MDRLVVNNVSKTFGETVALDNLSFSCKEGETVVLLGPTGAGKTTTLRCIAGLEGLDDGDIYIDDLSIIGIKPEKREIAMFFETYALYPHMNVADNISFPLKAPVREGKYTRDEIQRKTREIAELLQMEDYLNRKPDQLSGGQKQRTALGRALVRSPKVFLLDEPIAHLDAVLRHRMRGEMKRIFSQIKSTVVYVTHDYREALSIGDRILVINKGKIIQSGTGEDIYTGMKNMFVARLVGDPPMNFSTGRLINSGECYTLDLKEGELKFFVKSDHLKSWVEKDIVIGIRPHDIQVLKNKDDNCLKARLLTIEPMSSNYELTVELDSGKMFRLKSKERYDQLKGQKIWLKVNTDRIHIFNPQNEEAIYHGEVS